MEEEDGGEETEDEGKGKKRKAPKPKAKVEKKKAKVEKKVSLVIRSILRCGKRMRVSMGKMRGTSSGGCRRSGMEEANQTAARCTF